VLAGFAAQRGSICAVAAVKDLAARGKGQRYAAFFECAAWSLAIVTAAQWFGIAPASSPSRYAASVAAAIGGALFGLGASVNGACMFGSAARLGRGEIAFAAMPVGFLGGVAILSRLTDAPAATPGITDAALPSIVILALVFFVGFQLFRASDAVQGPRDALARLAAAEWPPSLAMGVIGVSSALLMIFFAPWPYSRLLVDIGVQAMSDHLALKITLAFAFVGGAAIGAYTRRVTQFVRPTLRPVLEKAAGGAMMGAGSYLIPGGNDSLVLVGLPHLFAYALVAYLSMTLSIAALVYVEKRLG
jgi:toxin CptA